MTRFTLVLTLTAIGMLGQTATVTGRVTDASDAVIAGTKVTVVNQATGVERPTVTNETGYYTVPLLQPGRYEIRVAQDGFKPVRRTGLILEVDQRAEINFRLEVGAVTDRVEVTADAVQINTVDASRGKVIENRRIVDMPLNGRDYIQLALLSAGTVQPIGGRYGGFSTAGMKTTQNNYVLDGLDNNGIELAGAQRRGEMVKPSVDAVQEFKIQTNAYAAEFGRAMGGVVNVTTKSGTNDLHGTAFWFLRNEKLDAKNFFDPADRPKPPFKRNQFGFSAGGPVVKNKTFLFGDYEGTRIRESATITSTIPSLRMKNGDFGEQTAALRDPNGGVFPNNRIPVSRFDRLGKTLIDLYPSPLNSDLRNNFLIQAPDPEDVDRWDVRADHNFSSRDLVFARVSYNDQKFPAALPLPAPAFGGGFDGTVTGWNTGLNWNHIFTPSLLMNTRIGWNYAQFTRVNPASAGTENLNARYGIPGVDQTQPGGFSNIGITGFRSLGLGSFNPVIRDSQNRQAAGDLTWVKGKHTVKFGGNILRSQNNIFNIREEVGNFNFNGRYTGNGAADLLLGATNQLNWSNRILVQLRAWQMGYFIQDDWKITPRLTVNLGVRYEVVLPFQEKNNKMSNLLIEGGPANAKIVQAGSGEAGRGRRNRSLITTDANNFMPRVGFAYKVNDRTVVRAGVGMFYGYLEPTGDSEYLIGNAPYAWGVTQTSSPTTPAFQFASGPPPGSLTLARATGLTFAAYEQDPANFYNAQWNLNIQRQIGRDWLFEIGYSGAKASHLLERYEGNYSPPGPGNLNLKRPFLRVEVPGVGVVSPLGLVQYHQHAFNSNYQALVTKLEKRFSQGFTLLTSYTFSKTLGDTVCGGAAPGNAGGCGVQDPRNRRAEKGPDSQHFPHRFVVSGVWELPMGRGRKFGSGMNRVADSVAGGWSLGSIVTWTSGDPFSATVAGNPANIGSSAVTTRPNLVGDPKAGAKTLDQYFNTGAFAMPPAFTLGSAGRNILTGPSQFNWDFSALKDFPLTERARLQFRFEAFAFTNTPRFGNPGNVLGTPNFGVIGGAGTPRNLQLALKLIW
jgi:hypothetical protein